MPARSRLTIEVALYSAILLLAILLRFANLGANPLNELEAQAALPAHQLSQSQDAALGDQPAYTLLAALTFFFAPSTEFLARFWPAVIGCALVGLHYFWRDLLGKRAAIFLSLALALDPGFVSISRLASGRMLALFALLAAITAWQWKKPAAAGAFLALALLSSPFVYIGLLGASLVALLFLQNMPKFNSSDLRSAGLTALAVLVLGGTLFFRVPSGLSGVGVVLAGFVAGWQQTGAPLATVVFALVTFGLPAVVFGLLGALRAWRSSDSTGKILSLFALLNLAIITLYPGRQVADLLWVTLPLWVLAATELVRYFAIPVQEPRAAWGEAGLMLLLIAFLVLALAKVALNANLPEVAQPFLFVAGGVVVLMLAASILIAFGWSRQAASYGLVWALSVMALLAMLADSVRFQNPGPLAANDLWAPGAAAGDIGLVSKTLQDLSYWQSGEPGEIVVDQRVDSAALSWMLRNFPSPTEGGASPAAIVTLATDPQPSEASSYRGQSFVLSSQPAWSLPTDLFGWLLYRSSPVMRQQAILWVDAAVFPDGLAGLQQVVAP